MGTANFRWLASLLLLLGAVFGAAEAEARRTAGKKLDTMLYEYSSNLRWSEFETAWTYVDPVYRSANPLSDFELERFGQFQVSGYLVKRREPLGKTEYAQTVEIRLVNRHTLTEKVLTERELWRWDAKSKRWWLTTGLPRLSQD